MKDGGIHPANDPFCEIFSTPKVGHPVCLDCLKNHGKRHDACMEIAELNKKAKGSPAPSGPPTKVKGKYADFGELKESLQKAPEKRMTMIVDKLLLEGMSIEAILSEVEERKKTDFPENRDFKNAAIVQKHIRFRASKGWVFKIFKNGKVKLVDYAHEPQTVSFTAASEDDKKDEPDKKAA